MKEAKRVAISKSSAQEGVSLQRLGRVPAKMNHCLGFALLFACLPVLAVFGQDSAHRIAGTWAGTLKTGGGSLRLALHVTDSGGKLAAKLDSLDQGAMGIVCADVKLDGAAFSFTVPAVGGNYSGTLNANGKTIAGTWTQGRSLPLEFTRLAKGARLAPAAGMTPAPAKPPIALADLKSVLDREFFPVLEHGVLAKSTGGGVVIGVLDHGQRRIYAYGAAQPDSIFEIGSVSKTFTGLLLAQMIEQKKVALDEPVRSLLPSGTVAKPDGPEITLLDLATQHSGLPRLPSNLHPERDPSNPYAAYGAAQLYAFLKEHGLALPRKPEYVYSNLGYGLLGFVLAHRADVSYGELVRAEITNPLHMADTVVALSPEQQKRFIVGHNAANRPVPPWTLGALEGAAALRSTAGDMLTYLEAQLHPGHSVSAGTPGSPAATLPAAISMTHTPRADGPSQMKVGMGWIYVPKSKSYWHNGGTGGYTSFVAFFPEEDRAIVVLYNREDIGSTQLPFSDRVAANVSALLAGKPAIPVE